MGSAERPLAYHITLGTYGARLHGDERGTVDRSHNHVGEPFLPPDDDRVRSAIARRRFAAVTLTDEQQRFLEDYVPAICERGGWIYRMAAAAAQHVHVCLSAPDIPGDRIASWLKRWLTEGLSERWPLVEGARWWAKGTSVKWIFDESYLANVIPYIERQRTPRNE